MEKHKHVRHKVAFTEADFKRAIERAKRLRDEPLAAGVEYRPGPGLDLVILKLRDGSRRAIPREDLQGLESWTAEQLSSIEIVGDGTGLRWPELNADVYVPGLLRGIYGSEAWMAKIGRAGGSARTAAKKKAARANGRLGGRPRKRTAAG